MLLATVLTGVFGLAAAQAPNTLGEYNPNLRTSSYNASMYSPKPCLPSE